MHRLTETSAVHKRIEDDESHRQQGERSEHPEGYQSGDLAPYSGYQGDAYDSFAQCRSRSEEIRGEAQEAEMQELEIFVHHESGTHGIHELEQPGDEEGEADDDRANSSYDSHSIPLL